MHIVFRADASLAIGTGHVMRCLTLAQQLMKEGAAVDFVSRLHRGHLCDFIEGQGIYVHRLPGAATFSSSEPQSYLDWLGVSWQQDAQETASVIDSLASEVDWLVVDHYALDHQWERLLRPYVKHVFVIDDLADRLHDCDLLLDQNLSRNLVNRYEALVNHSCRQLLGPKYALVRSEFAAARKSRMHRGLDKLLIFMGGSDPENETLKVVEGVKLGRRKWQSIDVVVGASFPHVHQLQEVINGLPQAVLHVQTSKMAELMADADLAVTAGGTVTWEKCTLGLPSLVAILSDNQLEIATAMHDIGAQITLGEGKHLKSDDYAYHLDSIQLDDLRMISGVAFKVCDGHGAQKISDYLREKNE